MDIAACIKNKASVIKAKKDSEHQDRIKLMKLIPSWLITPLTDFGTLIVNTWELNLGSGVKDFVI